jgi:hypothetical protein|mmetsp:Transcript_14720/g.48836  ORF Transcript_14720/g.48836 Transcript_14720/m.48836 type:complete len:113 (-) Transcript_14720:1112-1450(-)
MTDVERRLSLVDEPPDVLAEREQWLADRLAWLQEGGARGADGRLVTPLKGAAKAIKMASETARRVAKAYEDECRRREESARVHKVRRSSSLPERGTSSSMHAATNTQHTART